MKTAFLAFERRLTAFAMWLACAMLAIASALAIFQVLARFVFEMPAEWTEVLIRFALIWMVFLGIPAAFRLGSMVSVDLMHRMSPPGFRRVLDAVIALATIVLLAIILWYGWDYAQRGRVQTIIGLESYSMFWAYLAMPVGCLFAIVGVIGNFLEPRHEELETAQ
jgi:TRAP-type C4-dicarboxylate transport system permease small subunit